MYMQEMSHDPDDSINTGAKLVLKAFEKDLPYLQAGQKIEAFSNVQNQIKS
jgi:hypothetical protein